MTRVRRYVTLGVVVALGGSVLAASQGALPFMPQVTLTSRHVKPLLYGLFLLGTGGAWMAEKLLRPKAGRVEFYENRIAFTKPRARDGVGTLGFGNDMDVHDFTIGWESVVAFRDGSADFVELVSKVNTQSLLTVPTPREEDRVKVLALLTERGIPRREDA